MDGKKKVNKEALCLARIESIKVICVAIVLTGIAVCVTLVEIFGKC